MFSNRDSFTYANRYPLLWKKISSTPELQILTGEELITSMVVTPFPEVKDGNLERSWILVNTISYDEMQISLKHFSRRIVYIALIILILDAIISLILAKAVVQRNRFREALTHSALYDSLTNLPNRKLFYERIEQIIDQSRR